MNEKMSKRRIQITDLQKQEIEENQHCKPLRNLNFINLRTSEIHVFYNLQWKRKGKMKILKRQTNEK